MNRRMDYSDFEVLALIGAWVVAAIAFGFWQHSIHAGIWMLMVVYLYRWNRH